MKKTLQKIFVAVALTAAPLTASADETVISFLGSPSKTNTQCTPQDIMDLLTEEAKTVVDYIECANIQTYVEPKMKGLFTYQNDTQKPLFITIYLKESSQMKATRIYLYGGNSGTPGNIDVVANEEIQLKRGSSGAQVTFNKFENDYFEKYSLLQCTQDMKANSVIYANFFTTCQTQPQQEFILKSIKISPTTNNDRFNLHGLRIQHNGFVQDIGTSVEGIEGEADVAAEYFDVYGRKLTAAPASGLYLEKRGAKVTKKLATR